MIPEEASLARSDATSATAPAVDDARPYLSLKELATLRLAGVGSCWKWWSRFADRTAMRGHGVARQEVGGGLKYPVPVIEAALWRDGKLAAADKLRRLFTAPVEPLAAVDQAAATGKAMLRPASPPRAWVMKIARARHDLIAEYERLAERLGNEERAIGHLRGLARAGRLPLKLQRAVSVAGTRGELPSGQTLRSWFASYIAGGRALEALYPDGGNGAPKAEVSHEAWRHFLGYYLSPNGPRLATAWRLIDTEALASGWAWPCERTIRRKVAAEISPEEIALARKGDRALQGLVPPLVRGKTGMHALEVVNADGLEPSVAVEFPDGSVVSTPSVLWMMDVHSNCPLGSQIDRYENKDQFRRLNAKVAREFGLPEELQLDNTRACANKELTGGAGRRYRFKHSDNDPAGILRRQGMRVIFNEPGHPQAKPLERANRELKELIEKDPRVLAARAYCGDNPRERDRHDKRHRIPLELFQKVVAEAFRRYASQKPRSNAVCQGRLSYAEAFERSYQRTPIRRLAPHELSALNLVAVRVRCRTPHGQVFPLGRDGSPYWSPELRQWAGKDLIVRFNPDDLFEDVKVEDLAGNPICAAQRWSEVGFTDRAGIREAKRLRRDAVKKARAALDARNRASLHEIAAKMTPPPEPTRPESQIIAPRRLGPVVETPPPEVVGFMAAGARQGPSSMPDWIKPLARAHGWREAHVVRHTGKEEDFVFHHILVLERLEATGELSPGDAEWLARNRQDCEHIRDHVAAQRAWGLQAAAG